MRRLEYLFLVACLIGAGYLAFHSATFALLIFIIVSLILSLLQRGRLPRGSWRLWGSSIRTGPFYWHFRRRPPR